MEIRKKPKNKDYLVEFFLCVAFALPLSICSNFIVLLFSALLTKRCRDAETQNTAEQQRDAEAQNTHRERRPCKLLNY